MNADTFPAHLMGASRASSVGSDNWYCDSSATRHFTPNIRYFVSYTKFAYLETIVLGKKNVLMQAYNQGIINAQTFHNGICQDATLKKFGTSQMHAHIYSPSRQPPKTATAQH
jgi:hypothetical protein